MPASTTKSKPATPTTPTAPTALQLADALEKSKARVIKEFENSSYDALSELIAKLTVKYAKEELKL